MHYSFVIENENSSEIVKKRGPYIHHGPGNVSHCIDRLDKNSSYSVIVQVESIAGNRDSNRTYLSIYMQHTIKKIQELTVILRLSYIDTSNIKSCFAEGDMTTSTVVESSDHHYSSMEQVTTEPMDMSNGMQNLLSVYKIYLYTYQLW